MAKVEKTNAMRLLDSKGVEYREIHIDIADAVSGVEMAKLMGAQESCVFKTLVTVSKSLNHYVFVIPVAKELDLKKAALAVGEKSIEMVKSKELLPLTGYVHGGCSPIGMKKPFRTVFDSSVMNCERIIFSGGKIGFQIEITLAELKKALRFDIADLTC